MPVCRLFVHLFMYTCNKDNLSMWKAPADNSLASTEFSCSEKHPTCVISFTLHIRSEAGHCLAHFMDKLRHDPQWCGIWSSGLPDTTLLFFPQRPTVSPGYWLRRPSFPGVLLLSCVAWGRLWPPRVSDHRLPITPQGRATSPQTSLPLSLSCWGTWTHPLRGFQESIPL